MLLSVIAGAIWILISQALLATLIILYISIPIAVLIFLGYRQVRKRNIGLSRAFLKFLLAAFLFPMGEAVIGSAAYDTHSEVATNASLLLLGLSFLFTMTATVRAKGRRLFVFGVGSAFTIWTFWAWFTTQMSIANSWL